MLIYGKDAMENCYSWMPVAISHVTVFCQSVRRDPKLMSPPSGIAAIMSNTCGLHFCLTPMALPCVLHSGFHLCHTPLALSLAIPRTFSPHCSFHTHPFPSTTKNPKTQQTININEITHTQSSRTSKCITSNKQTH